MSGYTLRPYQLDASNALLADLETHESVGAVMPTGSGKTLVMIELIDKLRAKVGRKGLILVLCHLTDPLTQLFEEYQKHGERPLRVKHWVQTIRSMSNTIDTVFGTMQKMSNHVEVWRKRETCSDVRQPKFILIDEAHAYGAESYNQIRKAFPKAKIIGLSATPYRNNHFSFHQFDKVSYTISMTELIEQKYLVPPKLHQIDLNGVDDDAGRIALAYKIWEEKEKPRGFVTIIYFPTTQLAKTALAAYEGRARVAYLDGTSRAEKVTRVVREGKTGEIDIIVNCQKLETGVDIPSVGSVIMPYKCGSVARYLQRIGRGLRLYQGKEFCNVYLCGDAPSIASGDWQRMHDRAMLAKEPLPSENLFDSLDDSPIAIGPELLKWTNEAIEACQRLESVGMIDLAKHISLKRFPKKYDIFLQEIMKGAKTESNSKEPPTSVQKYFLTDRFGFKPNHVDRLNKSEASALINGFNSWLSRDPWILKNGPHIGKHPSQLPGLYKKHCRDRNILALLRAWYQRGRPALKDKSYKKKHFTPLEDNQ